MVGTLEEGLARIRARQQPELSDLDKVICRSDTAKHLVIPMCDIYNFRRIGDLLMGLGERMKGLSRRTDRPRSIILEMRAEIDDVNAQIRQMSGKGRRQKAYRVNLD